MKTTSLIMLLALSLAACGTSSKKAEGVPCDLAALAALSAELNKANGIGLNIADDNIKKEVDAAKAAVLGKHYAFIGCTFVSQGNDEVGFGAATGGEPSIDCTMKDGKDGVTTFRRAAMKIGQDKVRLDVRGDLAVGGMKGFERVGLRNCEISVHD
jgi:hypothetical protein